MLPTTPTDKGGRSDQPDVIPAETSEDKVPVTESETVDPTVEVEASEDVTTEVESEEVPAIEVVTRLPEGMLVIPQQGDGLIEAPEGPGAQWLTDLLAHDQSGLGRQIRAYIEGSEREHPPGTILNPLGHIVSGEDPEPEVEASEDVTTEVESGDDALHEFVVEPETTVEAAAEILDEDKIPVTESETVDPTVEVEASEDVTTEVESEEAPPPKVSQKQRDADFKRRSKDASKTRAQERKERKLDRRAARRAARRERRRQDNGPLTRFQATMAKIAGLDLNILKKCNEQTIRSRINLGPKLIFSVLFESLLVFFGLSVVIDNMWVPAIFGFIWGNIVFWWERKNMAEMDQEKAILRKVSKSRMFLRLTIAFLLAFFNDTNGEIAIFKPFLAEDLRQEQLEAARTTGDERSAEIEPLIVERARLLREITVVDSIASREARIGQDGRPRGAGRVFDRLEAEAEAVNERNQPVIAELTDQIVRLDSLRTIDVQRDRDAEYSYIDYFGALMEERLSGSWQGFFSLLLIPIFMGLGMLGFLSVLVARPDEYNELLADHLVTSMETGEQARSKILSDRAREIASQMESQETITNGTVEIARWEEVQPLLLADVPGQSRALAKATNAEFLREQAATQADADIEHNRQSSRVRQESDTDRMNETLHRRREATRLDGGTYELIAQYLHNAPWAPPGAVNSLDQFMAGRLPGAFTRTFQQE